jgi:hypothetical protein
VRLSDGRTVKVSGNVSEKELRKAVESIGFPARLPKDKQAQAFPKHGKENGHLRYAKQGPGNVQLPTLSSNLDVRPAKVEKPASAIKSIAQSLGKHEIDLPNTRSSNAAGQVVRTTSKVNLKTGEMTIVTGIQGRDAQGRFTKGYVSVHKEVRKTDPQSWAGHRSARTRTRARPAPRK